MAIKLALTITAVLLWICAKAKQQIALVRIAPFLITKKMAAAKDVRELKDPMQIKRLASAPKSKIVKHTMTTAAFAVFAKTDIVRLPTVNVKKSRLVEVTNKAVQAGQIIGVAQKL